MHTTGTSSAVSLSQYWNACTYVIARMPPAATAAATSTATSTAPTHSGTPATTSSVIPAPCSCGTMYSQPITSTAMLVTRRAAVDSSRASMKSGIVYAPLRRSGAATNTRTSR
ncbi:hypothetical protein SRABI66_04287 [Stenotrophomonas lactitubi]|nr:hypothetical protein SRABI66_04287 [Stenotrophomonas lactitubi]